MRHHDDDPTRLWRDLAIVAIVWWFTMAQAGSQGFGEYEDVARQADGVAFALAVLSSGALFWRRAAPWPVMAVAIAASLALVSLEYAVHFAPAVAAMLYTFASQRERPRPWLPIAITALYYAAHVAIAEATLGFSTEDYVIPPVLFVAVWLIGDRRRLVGDRRQGRQRLEIEQERTRIARELHDSAGHAINTILVQAGAARVLRERDPEGSLRAINAVEDVARSTLADIDRIVGALRDGEPADVAPLAGLDDIPKLVGHHRDAGFDFSLERRGEAGRPVPQPVQSAAYRIAQEALTNAARHGSGSARAVVELDPRRVRVTVENPTAAGSAARRDGGGLGLVGMRERAELLGGSLEVDAGDRRFRVEAVLPFESGRS